MIKRLLKIVELTVPEQRVMIVLLCALVMLVALKSYRDAAKHAKAAQPPAAAHHPSPSPGMRP